MPPDIGRINTLFFDFLISQIVFFGFVTEKILFPDHFFYFLFFDIKVKYHHYFPPPNFLSPSLLLFNLSILSITPRKKLENYIPPLTIFLVFVPGFCSPPFMSFVMFCWIDILINKTSSLSRSLGRGPWYY